jgi:pyruvate,orthophosphate dikinase
VRAPAAVASSAGTAGKLERIGQLADYGLNTPRLLRIEAGTPFDDELRARLRAAAEGDERMTVRTYHPTDETTHAKGPFAPELPLEEAIAKAEEAAADWHVLFQEAIDVNETVLAGNVLLDASGAGQYEVLVGSYRVRDVEDPPLGAEDALRVGGFSGPDEIPIPEVRELVVRVLDSGLLRDIGVDPEARVVIEVNVQETPVGRLRDPLLLWEWRPASAPAARLRSRDRRRPSAKSDGSVFGVGVPIVPAPTDRDAADVLGGKGFALAKMREHGLPVPPAVVLSVPPGDVPRRIPDRWDAGLPAALGELVAAAPGRSVSVRSSPTASMPGMLETVTNVPTAVDPVRAAVDRVLRSWWSERAFAYRRNRGLDDARLAVVVQAMVDGRADASSGTGVGFTRHPTDGDPSPILEFLPEDQGKELVGGRRTPLGLGELRRRAPAAAEQILAWPATLEEIFGDMQELELTIERGRPFLLQSRNGKRSAAAAVRIAHDLVEVGRVDLDEARERVRGIDLGRLTRRRLRAAGAEPIAFGRVAAPGATAGRIVVDRGGLERLRSSGDPLVLLADTTDPADYPLLRDLAGMVTRVGGATSHAAVAALEAGIVAVVGCSTLSIDAAAREVAFGARRFCESDWISVEAAQEGRVYAGRLPDGEPELPPGLSADVLAWAAQLVADG